MSNEVYEKGLAVRKAVLGPDFVEKSLATATEFNQAMQDFSTEYCWGTIWTREGLDLRTRSLLNLAMISALNRPHELRLHVRGAVNNGVTREEIREVFMQVAVYCGVPAAMDSFRQAIDVFKELDAA